MRTTSKITALAAAALATIALAACEPASNTTATTSSATIERAAATPSADWTAEPDDTVTQSSTTQEAIYILALDANGVFYATEQQAVDAGQYVCDGLDTGFSLNQMMLTYALHDEPLQPGVLAEDTGAIAGAGITAFCPEHTDQLDEFIATWGS